MSLIFKQGCNPSRTYRKGWTKLKFFYADIDTHQLDISQINKQKVIDSLLNKLREKSNE